MGLDLGSLGESLSSVPLPVLYAGATALFLLAIGIGRLIGNSIPAKTPPVFEGLPFFGGILKFTSVSEVDGWPLC